MLVRKHDDKWLPLDGDQLVEKTVSDCTITYRDGRSEVAQCTPYPIRLLVSIPKLDALHAEGVVSLEELHEIGLRPVQPFEAPEGKQAVGNARYEEAKDGSVQEFFDVEDLPPPPPPPTFSEKVAMTLGMTVEELREGLAETTK